MTVAEIVHHKIDTSVDFLLEKIQQNAVQDYLSSFTKDQFSGLVGKYRMLYPQNPFITEQQVKNICLEHQLKLASEMAFIGDIPERNQQEILNFICKEKSVFDLSSISKEITFSAVMDHMLNSFRGNVTLHSWSGTDRLSGSNTLVLDGALEGFTPFKFILPITKHMAIHLDVSKRYQVQPTYDYNCGVPASMAACQMVEERGGLSVVLQDTELNCIRIPIPNRLCRIEASTEMVDNWGGSVSLFSNIRAELEISEILAIINRANIGTLPINRKVIAPSELFNTTALKELDGYRYALDELAMTKPSIFVDDPIVLHPVAGGYLVVTKWGGESNLIDTNTN